MDALSSAVLFSDIEEESTPSQLNRAGFDDLTPVDTFINANGDFIFVAEE